jgi:excisionase family DNA binding protein
MCNYISEGGDDEVTENVMLTLPEVAKVLRVNKDTAYRLAAQGEIPSVKLGKSVRVPRAALMDYIDQKAREAVGA